VAAADVGREFACFKCNAALVVRKDGIRLAGAAAPQTAAEINVPAAAPESGEIRRGGREIFRQWTGRLGDAATWMFGIGAFLVILFLFFPLINQAKLARAKAAIEAGQFKDDRMDRELKQKLQEKKEGTIADEELRKKAHENWVKQKERMQADLDELTLDVKQSNYWYIWGMLIGFLFLAAAALGYLNPTQPPIRRVVGAIVIVAEVLLIFLKYLFSIGLS